ncbi:ABC transporter substrate-binding protein [Treponema vincentii]|uniref:ABC transporter substrate-binding protein n=1 Tax=Treponema vincentii TaxID=69710 RepID=UPI0022AAAC83|nr:ABC transporter substrate-binding protein [Treponema vincentii]
MNTRKIRWIAAVSVAALIAMSGCKNTSEVKGRDELIVGEAVDFASYEPIGIMDGLGFSHYSEMVYETLVRFENGEVKPALAERWEHDEHSWTFHLRRGVTFTDGEQFTAEAVKVNIEKMQEFVGDYLGYYGAVSRISAVEAADEYTVRFRYAEPYPAVLQELSASAFGMLSPRLFENGNNPYGSYTADTAGTGSLRDKGGKLCCGAAVSVYKKSAMVWTKRRTGVVYRNDYPRCG